MRCRLSCPFCGWISSDVKSQQHYGENFWVQCCSCGARGPRERTKAEAINGWQRTFPIRTDGRPEPKPVPIDFTQSAQV